MKTFSKSYVWILAGIIVLIAACKKNDPTPSNSTNGTNTGNEYLTAKIDGSNFEAMTVPQSTVSAKLVESNGNKTLLLLGSDAKGNSININIIAYDGIGTYYAGDNVLNLNTMTYSETLKSLSWSSSFSIAIDKGLAKGVFTVSKDDGEYIEGTFSFDGWSDTDSVRKITDGKFRAQVQ